MISALYVERQVAEHPITRRIRTRFADQPLIEIERYGEVFNRKAQNFRLQKQRPALILAHKFNNHVLPAPDGYGIGHTRNFYLSHMLNCVYDCRYCFLQGMYRSAHYVLFVNYTDFQHAMAAELEQVPAESVCFFTGYDCDSLALEPISGYVENLLPFCHRHPRAWLELRTKSTQIRVLLKQRALSNVIVAFSFTPHETAAVLEHKVPSVSNRISALKKLAAQGWPLGLRFDPLIYTERYQIQYRQLFAEIFSVLPLASLHSVSLGPFRLPQNFYRTMQKLYPQEPLLAGRMASRNAMVSYPEDIEAELREFCTQELRRYIPDHLLFPCQF